MPSSRQQTHFVPRVCARQQQASALCLAVMLAPFDFKVLVCSSCGLAPIKKLYVCCRKTLFLRLLRCPGGSSSLG